jgi:hypothetical protein
MAATAVIITPIAITSPISLNMPLVLILPSGYRKLVYHPDINYGNSRDKYMRGLQKYFKIDKIETC